MSKAVILTFVVALFAGAAADVRAPDYWTTLDNEYYSAGLEKYGDFIVVYGVELHAAAWVDGDDPALGYALPLTLGPVEADSEIELGLPSLAEFDFTDTYTLHVYLGVSGDEWVNRDMKYMVTHRFTGGEYDTTEVEGHHWSAPVTEDELSGYLHSVVLHTGGFFAETEGLETTGVAKLYLVVGVLADEVANFAEITESLREEQPEGTSVVFPVP